MKICWDNLKKVRLNSSGNLVINKDIYIEKEACKQCGESFLAAKHRNQVYCCKACSKLGKARSEWVRKKVSRTRIEQGLSKGKNNPMYGKKFSKEHRAKMSNALKGKYAGEKAYWYGKQYPQYVKDKISNTKKGMGCGSANPNWHGGKSFEPYCVDWAKEYKEYIRERDGNIFLNPYCYSNNYNYLVIHHIDYNKKNCGPNNLITLCVSCNSKANFDRDWHKSWYKAVIQKRYGGGV